MYVIHFIITVSVIALLKYRFHAGLIFSDRPFQAFLFWSVIFRSANFRQFQAISPPACCHSYCCCKQAHHRLMYLRLTGVKSTEKSVPLTDTTTDSVVTDLRNSTFPRLIDNWDSEKLPCMASCCQWQQTAQLSSACYNIASLQGGSQFTDNNSAGHRDHLCFKQSFIEKSNDCAEQASSTHLLHLYYSMCGL